MFRKQKRPRFLLQGLTFLSLLYRKKCLHSCKIEKKRGKIKKRWPFFREFFFIFYMIRGYENEQLFLEKVQQFLHIYFGETISRSSIQEYFSQIGISSLFKNIYYKDLMIFPKVSKKLRQIAKKHPSNHSLCERAIQLEQHITCLFEEFLERLLPDLSLFPSSSVEEYEELTEKLTRRSSPWCKIRGEKVHIFFRKFCKKRRKRKFYIHLTEKERQLIIYCKMAVREVDRLYQLLQKLQKKNIYDHRFDLQEFHKIIEIAQQFSCTYPVENCYTKVFMQLIEKKLRPLWKKKFPDFSEMTQKQLSFLHVREAFTLAKNHFSLIEELLWDRKEFIAKQKLIASIIYCCEKTVSSFDTLYPFTCREFQTLQFSLPPVHKFSQWHEEHFFSKKQWHALLQKKREEILHKFHEEMDERERKQIQRGTKGSFLFCLREELQKEIMQWVEERYFIDRFHRDFFQLSATFKTEKGQEEFSFETKKSMYFRESGKLLIQKLTKAYGKTFIRRLQYFYPKIAEKETNQPVEQAVLEEIQNQAIDLFLKKINRFYRSHIRECSPHLSSAQVQKMVRKRRNLIRRYCNTFLYECPSRTIPQSVSSLPQKTTLNQKTRVALHSPEQPKIFIDQKVRCFYVETELFFYDKRAEYESVCPSQAQHHALPAATTHQSFTIKLDQDEAVQTLYKGLSVNDRSLEIMEELYQLLRDKLHKPIQKLA